MIADLFARALSAHMAGDLAEAERLYRQTLEAEPGHVTARTNLATAWLQAGRLEDGAAALRRSLELDPRQPGALNNLGGALRAFSQTGRDLDCLCVELGILYRKRNEPDALGFVAQHLVAQQQIVFGLGKTA